jgi:hypothetical protein
MHTQAYVHSTNVQQQPQQAAQPMMVGAIMEQRVVGKRLKPEGWCCVFALAILFWPLMCVPCCLPGCQEDVVETVYVMPVRPRLRCVRKRGVARSQAVLALFPLVSLRAGADGGAAGRRDAATAADVSTHTGLQRRARKTEWLLRKCSLHLSQ